MRQLYRSEVDLIRDHQNKTVRFRLHHLTVKLHDQVITHLCDELNATDTLFPGTDLGLIDQIDGSG